MGDNWEIITSKLNGLYCLTVKNDTLIAGLWMSGINGYPLISTDKGKIWIDKSEGLAQITGAGNYWLPVYHILVFGDRIFISLDGDMPTINEGIFYSDDNMNTFKKSTIIGNRQVNIDLFENKGELYGCGGIDFYKSIDSCKTWYSLNLGDRIYFSIAFFNDIIFLGAIHC